MNHQFKGSGVRKTLTRLMTLGLIVGVSACDTDVVNPGPIESTLLNSPDAQEALTNGAGRALAEALNWIAYTSSAVAREVHPSGSTGSFGITPKHQQGELADDEVGAHWENAHRARFMAAEGLERILALDPAEQDQENLAQHYLWAGYTSRLMGETMCNAVIDGGAAEDSDVHLQNALEYFNQAEALGTGDVATAAVAGRASVNAFLGNWGPAVTDAQAVDEGFSYSMPYYDLGDDNQANRIFVAGKALPYKAHSQIFTWIADYNPAGVDSIADTDPRVSWRISGENGDAATSCCGIIEWWPQTKYTDDNSAIELSSYEEMQLILAENELVTNSDPGAAMDIINDLRLAAGVNDDLTAADEDEAWMWLMREHAIEQWLEGRRLPAMRRWNDAGLALESLLQPLERVGDGDTSTGSHLRTRDFCFPISEGEINTNPNITG